MFSPMVAMASEIAVSTVTLPTLAALIVSTSAPLCSATWAIILTRPWNCSLRATKSVSELTSTTTPLAPDVTAPIRPSAATRPAFLAAFDRPFLRSQSCAAVMSPLVSVSAALQSIMPAPVDSRSSLTIAAVIVAIVEYPSCLLAAGAARALRRAAVSSRECLALRNSAGGRRAGHAAYQLFRFRGQRLGLRDPGIGPLFAIRCTRSPPHFGQVVVLRYRLSTDTAWSTPATNPDVARFSSTPSTLSTSASLSSTSFFLPTQDAQLCRNTFAGTGVLNAKRPRNTTAACILDTSIPSSSSSALTWLKFWCSGF